LITTWCSLVTSATDGCGIRLYEAVDVRQDACETFRTQVWTTVWTTVARARLGGLETDQLR
jgi:hypothetical protein